MRTANVIIRVGCIAAVAGLGSWLAVEHQARLRAGAEHQALEARLAQLTRLVPGAQDLSTHPAAAPPDDPAAELARLRAEAGQFREQTQEIEAARQENRQAHLAAGVATADYWPRKSWAFAGYASPQAALQSSLWAADNGDLKTLLAAATGDLQKTMEEDFAGKSEAEASIKAMDEVSSFKSVRLLNSEFQGDDTAAITVSIENRTETQTVMLLLKKVGNDWKIAGPAGPPPK